MHDTNNNKLQITELQDTKIYFNYIFAIPFTKLVDWLNLISVFFTSPQISGDW